MPTGAITPSSAQSDSAKQRFHEIHGKPLFLADWTQAVFLHFRVSPEVLQPRIPFPLDLRDGSAWVSLVAFTMEHMRVPWLGDWSEWLLKPLCPCRFLNVRTYVVSNGEPGIYFISEWISNRCSVPLGPVSFGLPYRLGGLNYSNIPKNNEVSGTISSNRTGSLSYIGEVEGQKAPQRCIEGTLDHFLLERYTAFTQWGLLARCFRIWHEPWLQQQLDATIDDQGLLGDTGRWSSEAELVAANVSAGVRDVWISGPRRCRKLVAEDAA